MEGVPGEFAAVSIRKWGSEISPENLPALHLWRRPALPHDGGLHLYSPTAETMDEACENLKTQKAIKNLLLHRSALSKYEK